VDLRIILRDAFDHLDLRVALVIRPHKAADKSNHDHRWLSHLVRRRWCSLAVAKVAKLKPVAEMRRAAERNAHLLTGFR
jgi:hypothetical protein